MFMRFLFFILSFLLLTEASARNIDSLLMSRMDTLMIQQVTVRNSDTRRAIIPTQSLNAERLEKLSAYSISDAIRYFSGVQIKDYGGIGGLKTVNIRSMGSHHVGVYYDGIQIGNAQNGVVDLGRFSLDNMESVTLYNGQKSTIFQSAKDYASASSVYMTTRTPRFTDGDKSNINLGLKAGSFDTVNPTLLYEYKMSDNISLSFSGEYLYTSGEYEFTYSREDGYEETDTRENGDVELYRLEAAVFGKLKKGSWKAKAYYYNSERGYPGASVREEPGVFQNEDRQWDENIFVQGSYRSKVNDFYSILVNGKYAYDYLHYLSDPRLDVSTMYIDNTYKQRELYGSVSNLFTITDFWSTSLAMDFQRNTLDADLVDFVYPVRNSLLTVAASSLELNKVKLQASVLHTFVTESTSLEGRESEDKSIFTPSVVLSYTPFLDKDLSLRAFYKRIFRMPTLNDLYYTFIGNINLDPEYTTQYNIGFTYFKDLDNSFLKRYEVQADAYFNQVEDKIIAMPTSNQFRWTMINLGYVEIRGVDFSANATMTFDKLVITPRISYTYQKAQDFTDSTSEWYGGLIPYVPIHSGSTIVNFEYESWSLNYSYIYTGERYEAVANIEENYAQPWYTSDLSVGKNFSLKWGELIVTAEVNNLLNQQYEVVQCYPMPGRNYKIKVNIKL